MTGLFLRCLLLTAYSMVAALSSAREGTRTPDRLGVNEEL